MTERIPRRLAAILTADVVGYSRSMEADEAATLARLNIVRRSIIDPAVEGGGGRLVKTIGDGLLIEFASVVDAVRAAVQIQEAIAARNADRPEADRVLYRIGINLGDVVVEDGDLFGDGVNVAARLEALAEPGGICLSESCQQQLAGRLDLPLSDIGPQRLKNIARAVRAFRWQPGAAPASKSARNPLRGRRGRAALAAGMGGLVIAAAGGAWWYLERAGSESARVSASPAAASRLQARGRAAVAVLPFVNVGGDAARDYFADGLTEDVIGALGRFTAISVLSRNAVMPLKGKTLPTADLAKTLGVRYLIEGTVRHAGAQVRVSVQLSDAAAGRLLWSEQFDGEIRDVLAVQETIARRVVGVLAVRLTRAEQERAAAIATDNLEAYELVVRGRALLATFTRRTNVEARMLFERAIALDPRYGDAYVGLGLGYRLAVAQGWMPNPRENLAKAEDAARTAIRLDDRNSRGYALLGRILVMRQQFDQAKAASTRAIELNPSDAEGYFGLGAVLVFSGDLAGAIEALETGRAYDPSTDTTMVFHLGLAYYLADRPGDAVKLVEGAVGRHDENMFPTVLLSLAYAELGKRDEAREAVAAARRRNPAFDPEEFGSALRDDAHRAKVRAGLQKAGWY